MSQFDGPEIPSIVGGARRRGVPRGEQMHTDEIPEPRTYRRPRPEDALPRETIAEMRARHMAMMQLGLMWLAVIIGGLMMLGGAVRTVMWVIS